MPAVRYVQFIIMMLSILFNGFGFFTFYRRKKGNKNQHMLLQNLASVEIVKIVYDFISITLYYLVPIQYDKALTYFVVIEINSMTILYCSFAAVNIDRLLCVILRLVLTSVINGINGITSEMS